MVMCDLPYQTTRNHWDSIIPFEPLWEQYKRVIKPNGAIVLTASQPFTSALVMSNPKWFKYEWIWNKVLPSGFLNAKKRPMLKTESVLVFSDSGHLYNPQGLVYAPRKKSRKSSSPGSDNYGACGDVYIATHKGYPTNLIEFKREAGGIHPTQKPVTLWEYLIKTYTNEGELVLDFTAGSHTTAIACLNTNRKYICIEKEEKYHKLGLQRIANHAPTLQLATTP